MDNIYWIADAMMKKAHCAGKEVYRYSPERCPVVNFSERKDAKRG